jgi:lipopolysaccharide/colanic/teichoic acid biosynthesis glycosyltransferase
MIRDEEEHFTMSSSSELSHSKTGRSAMRPPTWKSAFDFFLSCVLLVATAPIMLLAMALVRLTSRGGVIYAQERLGLGGSSFTIYKIRTMYDDCERLTGPRWSTPGDPRVTPIGRILRSTHIDELPQLVNILRGEMSLVGPRPERPMIVGQLERALPCYRQRLSIRPGVTGLAQVQLPPDTDLEGVRRKLAYDLYYIERGSLWLDVRLIVATALGILKVPTTLTNLFFGIPGTEYAERVYSDRSGEMDTIPHTVEQRPQANLV